MTHDHVHVFWLAGPVPVAWERAALRLLAPDERARAARLAGARRARFVVARAWARSALTHCTDIPPAAWRFVTGRWGRPAPTIPGVGFSITHTASLIGCAVAANDAVGLDAERPANVAAALAHVGAPRVLSDSETAGVASAGPAERTKLLGTLWTLKEAYAKAIGAGLRAPLDALSFSLPPDAAPALAHHDPWVAAPDAWQLACLSAPAGHAAALAIRRDDGDRRIVVHPPTTTADVCPW